MYSHRALPRKYKTKEYWTTVLNVENVKQNFITRLKTMLLFINYHPVHVAVFQQALEMRTAVAELLNSNIINPQWKRKVRNSTQYAPIKFELPDLSGFRIDGLLQNTYITLLLTPSQVVVAQIYNLLITDFARGSLWYYQSVKDDLLAQAVSATQKSVPALDKNGIQSIATIAAAATSNRSSSNKQQ